ncbi:type II toxin-antitoxin system Phd/YefM family antitoxin [Aliiglaciecola litoralis]|uniref:type II toxin-antitoxin system Phd/YefM family antitoxin n=1 Tax=Aliiglaciecola litoralis TaxID=582857 RepID=UPI0031DA5977
MHAGQLRQRVELVTTLKRQATKILADLHSSNEPVLITEHGQPSAYLVDVDDYEFMLQRMQVLEGVARGEQAIRNGDTFSNEDAKEKMSKWLK